MQVYYVVMNYRRSGVEQDPDRDGPFRTMKEAREIAKIHINEVEHGYSSDPPSSIYIHDDSGIIRAKWNLRNKYVKEGRFD